MFYSIIIPVYNAEKYISRCINSILKQVYSNFEVIIVNDGSKDNSLIVCENYARSDKRIKVISQTNKGVSSARNAGLDVASGEFIIFVDADDFIHHDYLRYTSFIFENKNIDAVFFALNSELGIKKNDFLVSLNRANVLEKLAKGEFPTSLWQGVYKKSIISNLRLDTSIHFFEDFEFQSRVLSNSDLVLLSSSSFYSYECNEGSANNKLNVNNKVLSCLRISDKEELQEIFTKKELSNLKSFFFFQCFFYALRSQFISKEISEHLTFFFRANFMIIMLSKSKIIYKIMALPSLLTFRVSRALFSNIYKNRLGERV